MTLILSVCTREGIHLFSDSLVTMADGSKRHMSKIKTYENRFAISFYGDIGRQDDAFFIYDDIDNFISNCNVNLKFSEFYATFEQYCKTLNIDFNKVGFHITGYENGKPQLKHLMRGYELTNGEGYVSENTIFEYHKPNFNYDPQDYGSCIHPPYPSEIKCCVNVQNMIKQVYSVPKEYPALYNGSNDLFDEKYGAILISKKYANLSKSDAKLFLLDIFKKFIVDNKDNFDVGVDFPINYVFIGSAGEFIRSEFNYRLAEND